MTIPQTEARYLFEKTGEQIYQSEMGVESSLSDAEKQSLKNSPLTTFDYEIVGVGAARVAISLENYNSVVKFARNHYDAVGNGLLQNWVETFLWRFYASEHPTLKNLLVPVDDWSHTFRWLLMEKGTEVPEKYSDQVEQLADIINPFLPIPRYEFTQNQFVFVSDELKLADYGFFDISSPWVSQP